MQSFFFFFFRWKVHLSYLGTLIRKCSRVFVTLRVNIDTFVILCPWEVRHKWLRPAYSRALHEMLGPHYLAPRRRAHFDCPRACARVEGRAFDAAGMENVEVESSGILLHVGGKVIAGENDGEAVVVICVKVQLACICGCMAILWESFRRTYPRRVSRSYGDQYGSASSRNVEPNCLLVAGCDRQSSCRCREPLGERRG